MDFLELLRFSIDEQAVAPAKGETDWEELLAQAKRQTLTGVMYHGIERLPSELQPDKKMKLRWYMLAEKRRKKNEKTNAVAVELTTLLEKAGIGNCILKGQGNALLYSNPFSRTPGDIDVWIDSRKVVVRNGELWLGDERLRVKKKSYRHIEVGKYHDVLVEVHTRPSFMNNLIHNHRLQQWFDQEYERQFSHSVELPKGAGRIYVPTDDFNVIYQLCHINNHFFYEGIGLRQIIDYYLLLKKARDVDRDRTTQLLKRFGLYKMAGAVMYVESELLGLDKAYLIAPVNRKAGELLYRDIMLSGNFGKFDERRIKDLGKLGKNIDRTRRDLRLLRTFPSECLWEPVFRVYHFLWRLLYGNI